QLVSQFHHMHPLGDEAHTGAEQQEGEERHNDERIGRTGRRADRGMGMGHAARFIPLLPLGSGRLQCWYQCYSSSLAPRTSRSAARNRALRARGFAATSWLVGTSGLRVNTLSTA